MEGESLMSKDEPIFKQRVYDDSHLWRIIYCLATSLCIALLMLCLTFIFVFSKILHPAFAEEKFPTESHLNPSYLDPPAFTSLRDSSVQKKRRYLLMGVNGGSETEKYESLILSQGCYASLHDYGHEVETMNGGHGYQKAKPGLILDYFDKYDYIVWVDRDAQILDCSITLEDIIDEATSEFGKEPDMIIANSGSGGLNTGVVQFRTSDFTRKFLQIWKKLCESGIQFFQNDQGSFASLVRNGLKVEHMINSNEFQDIEHNRVVNRIATEAVDMCAEMKTHIFAVPSQLWNQNPRVLMQGNSEWRLGSKSGKLPLFEHFVGKGGKSLIPETSFEHQHTFGNCPCYPRTLVQAKFQNQSAKDGVWAQDCKAFSKTSTLKHVDNRIPWFHVPNSGDSFISVLRHYTCKLPPDYYTSELDMKHPESWPGEECRPNYSNPPGFGHGQVPGVSEVAKFGNSWVSMFREPKDHHTAWFNQKLFPGTRNFTAAMNMLRGIQLKGLIGTWWYSNLGQAWTVDYTLEQIEEGKRRLRKQFQFIGIFDRYWESVCLFHAKFSATECVPGEFIHKESKAPRVKLMEEDERWFDEYRDPIDQAVYDLALEIFESDLKEYGITKEFCQKCQCAP